MTLVNIETGEVREITVADVDASIARVIDHAESIWDEWAWQVENKTWLIGDRWSSWDEMRREVYGGLTSITAPRQERPELVARFGRHLTQKQVADTLGVSIGTVNKYSEPVYKPRANFTSEIETPEEPDVVEAELVEDEPPAPSPPVWRITAADWGEPQERSGATDWSRQVQSISARIPMDDLTDDEVAELLGAVEYLHNYIKGEIHLRKAGK